MSIHAVERFLPYTSEKLFDLVADVERYPDFVPFWVAVNVWKRQDNVYYTRQVLGLTLFLQQEFQSRTTLNRPEHINISSLDRPFRKLDMNWYFVPAAEGGTHVRLLIDFQLHADRCHLLSRFLSEEGVRYLVDTFEGRASRLFSGPSLGNISCDRHADKHDDGKRRAFTPQHPVRPLPTRRIRPAAGRPGIPSALWPPIVC